MCKDFYEDCPSYLRAYLSYLCVVKARTERTVEAYYLDIRLFLRYLKGLKAGYNIAVANIDTIRIADVPIEWIKDFQLRDAYLYVEYLTRARGNSPRTRARKISTLKQFYEFLHKRAALINSNPLDCLEVPKIPQSVPKYLTASQSLRLLESVDSHNKERDLCILLLFLSCGMRLSELVGLDVIDYNKENASLKLFGKGEKERVVYLNQPCILALEAYLNIRKNVPSKALFLSRNDKRIDKRRVQQMVIKQLENAGLANLGITTHKLRHTAATLMYESGVDMLVLKELLGHKSVSTTQIYTHICDNRLKSAAQATPIASFCIQKDD